jgi:hypothetical protein
MNDAAGLLWGEVIDIDVLVCGLGVAHVDDGVR